MRNEVVFDMNTLRTYEFPVWLGLTLLGAAAIISAVILAIHQITGFIFLAVFSIVALGVRDLLHQHCRRATKADALRDEADQLGWEFQDEARFNVLGWPDRFELTKGAFELDSVLDRDLLLGSFAASAIPKARHVFLRAKEDYRITLFDYEYSDNEVTVQQAVAAIESPKLRYSYFGFVPANLWYRAVDAFGGESKIVKTHRIVGEMPLSEPESVVGSMDSQARLEVCDGYMLYYRYDRRPLNVDDLGHDADETLQIFEAVCHGLATVPSHS